jgi:VWFA-related protein
MPNSRVVVAALLLTSLSAPERPAAQSTVGQDRQSFTSAATAILVDVVVRDKKGQLVTNLAAPDFELTEDGVAQKVDSFTRISRGGGIGVGVAWKSPGKTVAVSPTDHADGAPASSEPLDPTTTAIVFDHLSSESLRLAQRATLDYIPMNGASNARVGVFATDPGMRIVQRYTTDRTLVRQAVARLLPSGTTSEEQTAERNDELTSRRRQLLSQTASATGGSGGAGPALAATAAQLGQLDSELRMVQTELNMIRSSDNLDRDHRGYDTSLVLLGVIRTLSEYRGRKTVVFFSEGLPASPALSARLDFVIDSANRANVTAYVVDAHGLHAKSTLTNMRKEVDALGEERLRQVASGSARTDQPLTMAFERVEDTLRLDSRTGLARLAEDTGGFLVEQTNDLSSAFRRIDEDSQFHYLLTYSPKNADFDGKFRTIHVKVRRPGTQVFARKGYRAVRTPAAAVSAGYEGPALAMLDRTPLPNAFPVHAAAFTFPAPSRPGLAPVVVQVGTAALRFAVDPRRSTYSGQVSVVVRIRDGQHRLVEKLSQEYLLTGDAKDLEAAKNGEILFYREVDLAAGVYTIESIVFDAVGQQGSARVATLTVSPGEPAALGMSSLVLVNRAEEVKDLPASRASAPLYVGRTLLYPNLGEPIQKSATSELPFYFTLYGDARDVKVFAQLLRNGETIAEAPVVLPPATGDRLQHVGRMPIGSLPVGTYELRIRAIDGTREVSRSAFFTLK